MSLSDADIAFAQELFGSLPEFSTRKMFGGMGFYSDGVIFALMKSDNLLLLKAQDTAFVEKLAGMGSEKWTYTRKNGAESSMPYWSLPDAALDDPELALTLAHEALTLLR